MAELIAVINENGRSSDRLLTELERLRREEQIEVIEESFAQRLCGALSSDSSLVLFVAQDGERAVRAMQRLGSVVLRASLPEGTGLLAAQLGAGGTSNPQLRGQERRESGDESTKESGQ